MEAAQRQGGAHEPDGVTRLSSGHQTALDLRGTQGGFGGGRAP